MKAIYLALMILLVIVTAWITSVFWFMQGTTTSVCGSVGWNNFWSKELVGAGRLLTDDMQVSTKTQIDGTISIWAFDATDQAWFAFTPGDAPDNLSMTREQYYKLTGIVLEGKV